MATKKKAGKTRRAAARKPARATSKATRKKATPAKKKAAPVKKKAAPVKKKAEPAKKALPKKAPAPAARKVAPPPRAVPAVVPKVAPDRERTPVRDPVKALTDAAIHAVHHRVGSPAAPRPAPREPVPARPPAADGSERREHLRVPYGAWVNLVRDGRQEFCLARDISMGGLFLKSSPPPALGEQVQLLLLIENDSEPLMLGGIVVRRSESEGGFGVRFANLDARAAARLRDVVADASAAVDHH